MKTTTDEEYRYYSSQYDKFSNIHNGLKMKTLDYLRYGLIDNNQIKLVFDICDKCKEVINLSHQTFPIPHMQRDFKTMAKKEMEEADILIEQYKSEYENFT